MANPFIHGRILDHSEMIGRRRELSTIFSRLYKRQSTAIIGAPHTGKTTLLQAIPYLSTQPQYTFDSGNIKTVFSFVDAHTMHGIKTQAEFWRLAFIPLATQLAIPTLPSLGNTVAQLRAALIDYFTLAELSQLCADLNIDYETIAGEEKSGKVYSLVMYCQNHDLLTKLIAHIRQLRPHVTLPQSVEPIGLSLDLSCTAVYQTAVDNEFGTFVLEQLFRKLHESGQRFVLILDEFDHFLTNKTLHTAEFYGGLRSLASRCHGFALIIAARRPLEELNHLTQEFNPHGSPYFNTFIELHLGALAQKDLAQLLQKADGRFNREDRQFIADLSGANPYLAQVAAEALWDFDASPQRAGKHRYQMAADAFYIHAKMHFSDTWNTLTNKQRKIVALVALQQFPGLVEGQVFHLNRLTRDLRSYVTELDRLSRSGLVVQDKNRGWQIGPQGFVWWLADELGGCVEDERDFQSWLQRQSMDGILTREEESWLKSAVQRLGAGIPTLIEVFVTLFLRK